MARKKRYLIPGIVTLAVALILTLAFALLDREKITLDDTARSTLPGRFVSLSNGVVHYDLQGPDGAPTVLLVHGFSVPAHIFDPTITALAADGFRVVRFDLFGRGYSDRPDVDYTLDLFVNQLTELVDTLKIDTPFDIIGLSMGGPVVAAYTNRHPEKVRRLCLVDPLTEPLSFGRIFPAGVPLIGEYAMGVYVVPFLLPGNQKFDFYRPEKFPNWVAQYEVQMQYKGFRRAILSTLRHLMRDVDPVAEYRAVGKTKRPVLLFRGEVDRTVTADNIATIKKAIPNVRFHEIKKAGHIPHYERPEVVNPVILNFLKDDKP